MTLRVRGGGGDVPRRGRRTRCSAAPTSVRASTISPPGFDERGSELRTLVDNSIGPVWEANHVWLIYILVMWWTGFPGHLRRGDDHAVHPAHASRLAGIVLRGASFAFRKYSATFAQARLFGAIFAASSVITPFFLGAVAGAIASGRVPADGYGDLIGSWVNPTSLVGGCLAVGTCVFLAGVFLTADAARAGDAVLAERMRTRTLGGRNRRRRWWSSRGCTRSPTTPRRLSHGLRTAAAPLLALAALAGAATLVLLYRRRYSIGADPRRRGGGLGGDRLGRRPVPVAAGGPGHHR